MSLVDCKIESCRHPTVVHANVFLEFKVDQRLLGILHPKVSSLKERLNILKKFLLSPRTHPQTSDTLILQRSGDKPGLYE